MSSSTRQRLTEAAAQPNFDTDEQNNITVYRRVLPSVVSVSARTVQFDFFYGEIPQEGLGSGFIEESADQPAEPPAGIRVVVHEPVARLFVGVQQAFVRDRKAGILALPAQRPRCGNDEQRRDDY